MGDKLDLLVPRFPKEERDWDFITEAMGCKCLCYIRLVNDEDREALIENPFDGNEKPVKVAVELVGVDSTACFLHEKVPVEDFILLQKEAEVRYV